jgi:hypothetical protein
MKKNDQAGLLIVVRSKRKDKNLKSEGRSGKTGKRATVHQVTADGVKIMCFTVKGGTFKSLYKNLISTANKKGVGLPVGVAINHNGETFIPR